MSSTTATRFPTDDALQPPRPPFRGGGGDDGGGDGRPEGPTPPLNNARLAMLLVLIMSSMVFSAMIGGLIVLRHSSKVWPPEGSPPLPGLLKVSTAVILLSSVTLGIAHWAQRRRNVRSMRGWLVLSAVLGIAFLVLQLVCWQQLTDAGLLPSTNNFGGEFYLLSWTHAAHVVAAVLFLLWVTWTAWRTPVWRLNTRMDMVGMFWHFLGLIWIGLYFLLSS